MHLVAGSIVLIAQIVFEERPRPGVFCKVVQKVAQNSPTTIPQTYPCLDGRQPHRPCPIVFLYVSRCDSASDNHRPHGCLRAAYVFNSLTCAAVDSVDTPIAPCLDCLNAKEAYT